MARKLTYNHVRFDGGMTHHKRDTSDLTKLGLISHLDIYRDRNEMSVMPGFVSDTRYSDNDTGLKTHDVRNFSSLGNYIFALGTKSDGTGSKVFQKVVGVDTQWSDATTFGFHAEGADDLIDHPFFTTLDGAGAYFPVLVGGNVDVARVESGSYTASWFANWIISPPTGDYAYTYIVESFNGSYYLVKGGSGSGISLITSSTVTTNIKTTAIVPLAIASGDYSIGIAGVLNNPRDSRVLVWDAASLLADQNIRLGSESVRVIGFPNNFYSTVSFPSFFALETNGKSSMVVRVLEGESASVYYQLDAPTSTNMQQHDINEYYRNAMLWYARIPTNTDGDEFVEGVWAAGSGSLNSQFGVSILLDTSSLGQVERAAQFGFSTYFAHNLDGSVSRLDDFETGTYDVPATIETLIYGADSPYQKELNGLAVVTEDLPSGASVVGYYRTDEQSAWTAMGTSNTVGSQKHSFTKAQGTPIGKFQEIQFKIIITGKVTVKNIFVQLTETENLPF